MSKELRTAHAGHHQGGVVPSARLRSEVGEVLAREGAPGGVVDLLASPLLRRVEVGAQDVAGSP
eukprot:16441380-Heterocapsa_arctica.AAC.1